MTRFKTLHAVLMITGTCVGTGILGLPIVTGPSGLIPTLVAFVVAWVFMTIASLYILDVKLHFKQHYNLSSLIKLTLGRRGYYFSCAIIILLLYALLCTYMITGSAWFKLLCAPDLPSSALTVLFTLIFGAFVFFGEKSIYKINNILGFGLMIAFLVTICLAMSPPSSSFLQHRDWTLLPASMPLLLTTFGFSIVVPSVTEYLDYDAKKIKFSIITGSLIAFFAYGMWEWITLAHIPANDLTLLYQHGDNGTGVVSALASALHNPWVTVSGQLFAIFAAITSFLGVSLALLHFLTDILTLNTRYQSFKIILMMLCPPLLISLFYPLAFIQILSFAGLFVAVLLGAMPAMMMLKTHPTAKMKHTNKAWPVFTMLFFCLVIVQELFNLFK